MIRLVKVAAFAVVLMGMANAGPLPKENKPTPTYFPTVAGTTAVWQHTNAPLTATETVKTVETKDGATLVTTEVAPALDGKPQHVAEWKAKITDEGVFILQEGTRVYEPGLHVLK